MARAVAIRMMILRDGNAGRKDPGVPTLSIPVRPTSNRRLARRSPGGYNSGSDLLWSHHMAITKDTIGVVLIGAGDISILHAAAVKKWPGAKLVGLWNRNQDRAKQRAGEFGCKNYATPEALVNDPAIDAVFVLTNLETHLEYTALALGSGKHVLVEKPVGVSVAEIERMKAVADAKG